MLTIVLPQPVDEDLPGMGQFYCPETVQFPKFFAASSLQHGNVQQFALWPCTTLCTVLHGRTGILHSELTPSHDIVQGKYFITLRALQDHKKSRFYKMRVKQLKGPAPHSKRDAELAAGLGVDNGPKLGRDPRKLQEQQAMQME
jgi:hypothetical protein